MDANVLLKYDLSPEKGLTLSSQLGRYVRQMVDEGELAVGDALPTEKEFCDAYNVSRSTIRQALKDLVDEGLLTRIRGKGTYVAAQKLDRRMESVYSFTHEMEAAGMKASSRVLAFRKIKPPRDIARILFGSADAEDEVFSIIRIRLADGVPHLLETDYIPVAIVPNLTEERLNGHSLYDILREDAGVVPNHAEETYESCLLERSVCALLDCPRNTTGFSIRRITYDKEERIYEVTSSIMRGDCSRLVVSLRQGSYRVWRKVNEYVGSEE